MTDYTGSMRARAETSGSAGEGPHEEDAHRALLADLQGNIIKAHARHYALHLFLSFDSGLHKPLDVRAWIRHLAARRVRTAWQEETLGRHGAFCSFLLSSKGYRWLGAAAPEDPSFQLGMKERGAEIGDSPVKQWEPGYRETAHALLVLADHDPVSLAADGVREKTAAHAAGLSVVVEEPGYRLLFDGYDVEHFGYRDGISQPVSTPPSDKTNPGDSPHIDYSVVLTREPGLMNHYGSFLVFRKLEQNVALWERNIIRLAAEMDADPALVGAFAVGRFKDGTPVVSHDRMRAPREPENDFRYTDDPDGNRCPLHAHIRKTNPRGEETLQGSEESYPRIARCGMSYGVRPDLHPAGGMFSSPEKGVGLLFMCYQSSIEGQFEHIQRDANSSDHPRHGSGPDPLIAQGEAPYVSNNWQARHGSGERFPFVFERAVTLKGGEYFFAPSLTFLNNL